MKTDLNSQNSLTVTGGQHAHKEQLFEVSVFLFLIIPSMALSFFAVKQGSLSFLIVASGTILRDLAPVSLILFFLWRNSERVERIGWTFKKGWKDIGLGIGLFVPLFFAANLLENALRAAGFSVPATPVPSYMAAKDAAQYLLASLLVSVVALAEETVFRGYLILRFKALTASPATAVLLSAAIFSLGHGYEGSAGVITVGFMGLVFALVYLWRQSLVAPMVMHFLQDFIGIVPAPLLGLGDGLQRNLPVSPFSWKRFLRQTGFSPLMRGRQCRKIWRVGLPDFFHASSHPHTQIKTRREELLHRPVMAREPALGR